MTLQPRPPLLVLVALLLPASAAGQMTATALLEEMARLDGVARVVVLTARPEHDPAALVAWLHLAVGAEVSVVGLHRGESGGNRFGREVGEALGVLRAQELAEARRITGGRQYFTRAYDYGDPGEGIDPLEPWPVEELVGDLVTIFRERRPHLVILPCPAPRGVPDPHGLALDAMAEAAFSAAGDTIEYPVARSAFRPAWQPLRLHQMACPGEAPDVVVPLDSLHLPRGESFARIGGRARAMQRSAGLGAEGNEPTELGLRLRRALDPQGDIPAGMFSGVPVRWDDLARLPDLPPALRPAFARIAERLAAARAAFDPRNPDTVVPRLTEALDATRAAAGQLPRGVPGRAVWTEATAEWNAALSILEERLTSLLVAIARVEIRLEPARREVAQRDTVTVTLTIHNRGTHPVTLREGSLSLGVLRRFISAGGSAADIAPGTSREWQVVAQPLDPSMPWWLTSRRTGEAYSYPLRPDDRSDLLLGEGTADDQRALLRLDIAGVDLRIRTEPVAATRHDPDRGEVREPMRVLPPVTILFERQLDYLLADRAFRRRILLEVRSWVTTSREVAVRLVPPEGVTVADGLRQISLQPGERRELLFELGGQLPRGRAALRAYAESEGEQFILGPIAIGYDHVPGALLLRAAGVWLDAVPVRAPAQTEIGYLPGDRDFTQVALRQLNLRVTDLTVADLDSVGLARFRRLVIGPHALRAPELRRAVPEVLAWIERGGRLVVQQGAEELGATGMLPWPFEVGDRARALPARGMRLGPATGAERWWREPNALDDADVDQWVGTLAAFLPDRVDARYRPVAVAQPAAGGPPIPVAWAARVGAGWLVYTALTLPPQVLSGEGGALRLLVNLLFADGR